MKKILIITDCDIGVRFIERTVETYSKDNLYYVVQTKERFFEKAGPDRFKFFTFDPTSRYKLARVLKMDFVQAMVVMQNRVDAEQTLRIIRQEKPYLRVIMLDRWGQQLEDKHTLVIDVSDQISSRLIDYLPNVPVIAQNVGLGEGEIMEALVPFGSAYVYRHVGAIEQTQWRIAGIYRDQRLILPTEHTLIHPNDLLLLVGEPDVLISIYRSIKRELGHFPAPYGTHIYLYVDMDIDKGDEIIAMLRKTVELHIRLRRSVVIQVVNPSSFKVLQEIKGLRSDQITVNIDYDRRGADFHFFNDKRRYHVGLVVVSRKLFQLDNVRKVLFELKLPVLKMAETQFHGIHKAVVLLSESEDIERITTTVFDLASQLEWQVDLLEFKQDHNKYRDQIEEYYRNLSAIFSQPVKIVEMEENPLRHLKKEDNFLHCLPFTESTLERPLFSYFSTDIQRLYFHLDRFHQMFIPI